MQKRVNQKKVARRMVLATGLVILGTVTLVSGYLIDREGGRAQAAQFELGAVERNEAEATARGRFHKQDEADLLNAIAALRLQLARTWDGRTREKTREELKLYEGMLEKLAKGHPMPAGEGQWTMFRRDIEHSARVHDRVTPPLGTIWKYSLGQPIVCSPAAFEGRVCVGSRDSTLYTLDAENGEVLWRFKTGGWIDSSPAMIGDLIYFASRDGFVYCLHLRSGGVHWSYSTGGADCSSPAIANGRVYLGSGFPNTHVLALDSNTGRPIWRYQTEQPVYSSPAVKDGDVYIGSNDGKFYALSQLVPLHANPRPPVWLKWVFPTNGGIYFSSPAMADSLGYFIPGNYDKNIYCLRLSDGSVKWSYEVLNPGPFRVAGGLHPQLGPRMEGWPCVLDGPDYPFVYVSSPALAHGMVYFVSGYPEQSIYALDALSGSLQWNQPIGQATPLGFSSSPTVGDSVVWVGSGEGTLYAFHALNGDPLWSLSLGSPIVSCPTISDGKLWVGTWGGDLICLQPSQEILASREGGAADFTRLLPETCALLPPSPNPFTASTTIRYHLMLAVDGPRTAVSLSVYDLSGRLVRTLVNRPSNHPTIQPYNQVVWDGKDNSGQRVPAGIYFIRLRVGDLTTARRAVLIS